MKKIYQAENPFEAQNLLAVLQDAGITSYSKEADQGEYLKITSGSSACDIFVNDKDEAQAKALVKKYRMDSEKTQKRPEGKKPWYRNKTILARIMLAYAAIMAIIIFFSNVL